MSQNRLHAPYREIESSADELTNTIHMLNNDNVADKQLLNYYNASLEDEGGISASKVKRIFKEAQTQLSESIVRSLSEAEEFHAQVVDNRRVFLSKEIESVTKRILDRESSLVKADSEKSELMRVLDSHGALE